MSHLHYEAMASPKTRNVFSHYAIALWRILRLALFFSCLLFSILVSLGYGINQNSTGPIASKSDRNIMKPFSPLQSLLNKDSDAETQLSYDFSLSQHFSHLCAAFLLLHFLPALLSFPSLSAIAAYKSPKDSFKDWIFNRHPLLPTPHLEINKFCPTDLNF
jgi:hypothetical protein